MPTIGGDKWLCDTPGCGRRAQNRGEVEARWQLDNGLVLCPRCATQFDDGVPADDYQACDYCEIDWRSGEDEWHTVETAEGLRQTYCANCWATRFD